MCTVTFIARRHGYALGMNRDEQRSRARALPPQAHRINRRTVLFPSEPRGGTWIGLNDAGVTLALINWYRIPNRVESSAFSRGDLVRAVLSATADAAVTESLAGLPLERTNPFRLLGFFPSHKTVMEWRWDLKAIKVIRHPWQTHLWASSGSDEPGAQHHRSITFDVALQQRSAGGLPWLRRLHRSHRPHCGPHSICMHRKDAMTLSYTEVTVSRSTAAMSYKDGSPCRGSQPTESLTIPITAPPS